MTRAKVLVELGELHEAEAETADLLDRNPDNLTALSLFAKIKHIEGDLSQAVACWAQIHSRSPHNPTSLMHLGALLHLTQDPAQGVGEFLVLGQFQLARRPASDLELAEAFKAFLGRRPVEARHLCRQMAQKHRGRHRDIYKLAVLADAWIAEMSGDLDAAAQTLETLAHERGFEDDLDRIVALCRVYERIGTTERLTSAVQIYRHLLDRFDQKISALGHLAVLYRRLGMAADSAEYDARFYDVFRRRMHRPSLREAIQASAATYLPLERLGALRLPGALDPQATVRERAIADALAGDRGRARSGFARGGETIDERYLGDLARLDGDTEEAARLYVSALSRAPGDLRQDLPLVGWLLDHEAAARDARLRFFRDPVSAARVRGLLGGAIRVDPRRPAPWRWLASFLSLQEGEGEEARRALDRARSVEAAARQEARPIGRALAASVYHFLGKAKGLIHEIWAGRQEAISGRGGWLIEDQILGNLTPDMKVSVRNTFLAVREYARAKFPHLTRDIADYNYTFKVTKEDEPSGGSSAGLPTALAFLSVFLQRPIPQDMAATGILIADAHDVLTVQRVGEAEYKVKGAYNRNLRLVILPRANRTDLAQSAEIPSAVCEELVSYAVNLDDAVKLVFGEDTFHVASA